VARGRSTARDEASVSEFVERFSSSLIAEGFPRMAARVFVALLATDSGELTSAELAERLQISPAAVSSGVRYLIQIGLARRTRTPGSRRDVYELYDDIWYEAMGNRDQQLARLAGTLRDGVAALGPDTEAGRRVEETAAFFDFARKDFGQLIERWRKERGRT